MIFEDIVEMAKKQAEYLNTVLDLNTDWMSRMAIDDQGNVYFDAKTFKFTDDLQQPFSCSYKKTKIWLNKQDGNSVEFFFSFPGDTLLKHRMDMDIPIDEFILLKQVLKLPDGFVKIYPFSISIAQTDNPWFSFSFNERDGIIVPLP